MQEWIEGLIYGFLEWSELTGYWLLFITVPLGMVQGVFTLFPFATLFLIHVTTFGMVEGLLVSGLIGSLSSLLCFSLSRYLLYDWFQYRFARKIKKYDKWQQRINRYGGWAIILLRTFPFAPSNLISIMASLSPMRLQTYIWSTTIGTFSHLWLLALLGASVFMPDANPTLMWVLYGFFCLLLCVIFLQRVRHNLHAAKRAGQDGADDAEQQVRP